MATTIVFGRWVAVGPTVLPALVLDDTTVTEEITGTDSTDPAPALNGAGNLVGVRIAGDAEFELTWGDGTGPLLVPAGQVEVFAVPAGTVLTVTPTA